MDAITSPPSLDLTMGTAVSGPIDPTAPSAGAEEQLHAQARAFRRASARCSGRWTATAGLGEPGCIRIQWARSPNAPWPGPASTRLALEDIPCGQASPGRPQRSHRLRHHATNRTSVRRHRRPLRPNVQRRTRSKTGVIEPVAGNSRSGPSLFHTLTFFFE